MVSAHFKLSKNGDQLFFFEFFDKEGIALNGQRMTGAYWHMNEWELSQLSLSGWPLASIITLFSLLLALLIKRLMLNHLRGVTSQPRYY